MNSAKKAAVVFLSVINILTLASGIITELTMALGGDVTSIIPIQAQMTVNQILLLNFTVIITVTVLISFVTAYLVTDMPYSPKEILSNCSGVFMILPVLIFCVAIYNAVSAEIAADRIWIILSGIYFVLVNLINFGCILTVKYDSE